MWLKGSSLEPMKEGSRMLVLAQLWDKVTDRERRATGDDSPTLQKARY